MSTDVRAAGPDRLVALTAAVLVVTAGAVVVAVLLGAAGPGPSGVLGDPGPLTTTGLPLARYLQDLLGTLVVGCALLPVLAGDGRGGAGPQTGTGSIDGSTDHGTDHSTDHSTDGTTDAVARRAHRLLAPAAAAWAVVTGAVYVLTASDLSGRPVPRILTAEVQGLFVTLPQARAQLLVVLAAVVLLVASLARAGQGPWVARGLLLVAAAGLLPPGFVGHSAAAADHETAVASVSVHLVAGAMWVGGLLVLALLVLSDRRVPVSGALPLVRSFSTLALGCVVVVGASGVLNGALRVGPGDLLTSAYGLLLLAKTAGLAGLVGLGWWHRRHSMSAMESTPERGRAAFVRLVVVELAVMALTVAAAVALARTPPPGLPGA